MRHPTENTETGCQNCGIQHDWYLLTEYITEDGPKLQLCDDCAKEQARIEASACHLASLPSCEARTQIVDAELTTHALVNALRAHDMVCPCAAKKPIPALAALYREEAA